jgi:hypothetical protein
LLDREYMLEMIYRKRYGDKRLQLRVESRRKLGLPLWGYMELAKAAE